MTFPKPSRAERKKAERKVKRERADAETAAKNEAKEADGCRFPRCGCRLLGLALHGAHFKAKGMGGDHGLRSTVDNIVGLCVHRHQTGRVSLHGGTLAIEILDISRGTRGPLAWHLHTSAIGVRPGAWLEIARETEDYAPDDPRCAFAVIERFPALIDALGDMEL